MSNVPLIGTVCRTCRAGSLALVRRRFTNGSTHAVLQCEQCREQTGGAIARRLVGDLADLQAWAGDVDEQPSKNVSAHPACAADPEAPLRMATMARLKPWFHCEEEVPVHLREGGTGRIDIMARPLDERFARFVFAIEEKARHDATSRLAARLKQAADYVGARVPDGGVVTMAFIDLIHPPTVPTNDAQDLEILHSLRVAHQFRVGALILDDRGMMRFRCGPDDIWHERVSNGTGEHWPGRALERLTNTRQSGGQRR